MNFENWLDEKVKDKYVLEIGGLSDIKSYQKNNFKGWRHNRLKNLARHIVGGDINKDGIELVRKYGFNYIYLDIEKTNISDKIGKFDVILMLDVIEHLNNVGKALENLKNYMKEDTELIITTPNPFSFNNIVRVLLGKKVNTFEDHTVWLDESNFKQLAKRFNFDIKEVHYITFNPQSSFKQKLIYTIGNINKYLYQNLVVVLKNKS